MNNMHLISNMVALFLYGLPLIKIGFPFISLYLFSILSSGVFTIWFLNFFHLNVQVIGASGAIFGIVAVLLLIYNRGISSIIILILETHIVALLIGINDAWYTHLGGALGGIVFYLVYRLFNKR